jgi:hypothetical protein
MILSGSAVQVTGLGSWFISATKRLMAAWRSTTHRKTPRFSRRLASLAKEPLDGVEPRTGGRREESWSRKSAQDGKWNFCLTAGTLCEVGPVQFFRVE